MLMFSLVTWHNNVCRLIGFLEMLMGVFQLTTSIHFPVGPGSYIEHSVSPSVFFIGFLGPWRARKRVRQEEWGVRGCEAGQKWKTELWGISLIREQKNSAERAVFKKLYSTVVKVWELNPVVTHSSSVTLGKLFTSVLVGFLGFPSRVLLPVFSVLGFPRWKSGGTTREISGQVLFSLCSSTRETAQRKGPPNWLSGRPCWVAFIPWDKACVKRWACGKGGLVKGSESGIFHVRVRLLPPVSCLATISHTCPARANVTMAPGRPLVVTPGSVAHAE